MDFEKRLLVVSKPKSRVEFEIKLLGSCRDSDSSWEWAWNNPNVERQSAFPRAELALVAKKYELRYLNSGVIVLPNEKFPWYLGGIALKVSPSAVGIYGASGEGMSYFFVLYRPREYFH